MNRARMHGLTLIELLVTLVLVSLTVALVVGGIGQASGLLARVSADQGEVYQELMAREWLRQTIAAAAAPLSGQRGFEGTSEKLHLRSFRPLLGSEGVATEIEWSGAPRAGLVYAEGEQQLVVGALPALQRFEYQDEDSAWHEQWPPDEKGGLPRRVRIVFADGDDRLDVRLVTQVSPLLDAEETEFDRE